MCWCDDQACRLQSVEEMRRQVECPTPGPMHRDEQGYNKHTADPKKKWRGRLFVNVPREHRPTGFAKSPVAE
jgi:hypothetical protein